MGIPIHIAVIMDGNGRWAKQRGLPRSFGHKQGAKRVEELIKNAKELGINIVTLFTFSTENWLRPKTEINMLFSHLKKTLIEKKGIFKEQKIRVKFVGRRDRLDSSLLKVMAEVESSTQNNKGFFLNIALDYGGKWDIVQAVVKMGEDILKKTRSLKEIDESSFEQYLALSDVPYPDLLIRTSGELRISNFLLWQLAYAEFYFTPCLWPDFDRKELEKTIASYAQRQRRFGKVSPKEYKR